jgi:hypothetical protein
MAALSHVPRDQWLDDVLTYQREQQRLKKRKDREMQIEDDRLRREVEQQRRQEQLAKIAADEPEEPTSRPTTSRGYKSGNVNRKSTPRTPCQRTCGQATMITRSTAHLQHVDCFAQHAPPLKLRGSKREFRSKAKKNGFFHLSSFVKR